VAWQTENIFLKMPLEKAWSLNNKKLWFWLVPRLGRRRCDF